MNTERLTRGTGQRIDQHWRRSPMWRSVVEVMAVVFVAHLLVSQILQLPASPGRYDVLIGVAYFVFGVYSAFTIESSRARLGRINELLKAGDGDLISVYRLVGVFGTEQQAVQRLIDEHMQDQIDFKLVDFGRSGGSLSKIERYCLDLEPATEAQSVALDHLVGRLVELRRSRQQLEALVRQRVTQVEWGSLLFLFATLWLLMLFVSGGPFVASLIGAALVSSLVGTMVVLWHLDTLRWQEGDWIWRPLHSMFLSLDLVPYYHRQDLIDRRMEPPGFPVRAASFPRPYPDLDGKVVEVLTRPLPSEG